MPRTRGSRNKKTAEAKERYEHYAKVFGFDPFEFLFACAANQLPGELDEDGNQLPGPDLPLSFRRECARDLLPYRFTKRTATQLEDAQGGPIQLVWQLDDQSDFELPPTAAADSPAQAD